MAPKRRVGSSGSKNGTENQTMVIVLVFFVLLSIGLGIGTYTGFSQVDAKEKESAGFKKDITVKERSRDMWKYQALLYLAVIGHLKPEGWEELNALKGRLDGDTSTDIEKEKVELRQLVTTHFDPKIGPWQGAGDNKVPALRMSYEKLLEKAAANYADLEKQVEDLRQKKALAEKARDQADELVQKTKQEFEAKFGEVSKKLVNDQTELLKMKNDLLVDLETATKKLEDLKKDYEDKIKGQTTESVKMASKIQQQKELIAQRQEEIAQLKQKGSAAPANWQMDWRIVSLSADGKTAHINLGSRDNVQPQLTFTIHGVNPDGKTPSPERKGTLEVVNVLGEKLSQARITSVESPYKDPILKDDVLFNGSWSPTLKKHVALAGIIDLTGDGRDGTAEFRRNLVRQNILVDAYVDRGKDFAIQGPGISVQTDYLIVGDGLENARDVQDKEMIKKMSAAMDEMRKQATENGVKIVGLKQYLELIGYRLPRGGADQPTGPPAYGR